MNKDKAVFDLSKLSSQQYKITQQCGTEAPFSGEYNDHYQNGHYDCVVCNTIMFNSQTKFHSGTGWPSFFDVAKNENIKTIDDTTYGMRRIEIRCSNCNAHLGHVFPDGPKPTGMRYCVNSASLKFVASESKP